jgi:hypothetical protein
MNKEWMNLIIHVAWDLLCGRDMAKSGTGVQSSHSLNRRGAGLLDSIRDGYYSIRRNAGASQIAPEELCEVNIWRLAVNLLSRLSKAAMRRQASLHF